jgi:tRNA-binding EMAP/Myf-like protein
MNNVTIDDFSKIEFRIGEVKSIDKKGIKIICDDKDFLINIDLDVKKKDKLAIIIAGEKLIVPVIDSHLPLSPEKDIELGSRVS